MVYPNQAGRKQRRPAPRRTSTNPASVALTIVGLAIVTGGLMIMADKLGAPRKKTGSSEKSSSPRERIPPGLKAKLAELRSFSGNPEEGIRKADALYLKAKSAQAQKELLELKQEFRAGKARRDLKSLLSRRPELLREAREGDFTRAVAEIEKFENANRTVIEKGTKAGAEIREEIKALRSKLEEARNERFEKDFAALKKAIAKEEVLRGSTLVETIGDYATSSMRSQAEGEWNEFYSKLEEEERKKLRKNRKKDSSPSQREFVSSDPPYTTSGASNGEEKGAAPDNESPKPSSDQPLAEGQEGAGTFGEGEDVSEGFFGDTPEDEDKGGENAEGSGRAEVRRMSLFAKFRINKDRTFQVALKGKKVKLIIPEQAVLYHDSAISSRKYVEHMEPGIELLFFCESTHIRMREDIANGRRLRNARLLIMGEGLPDPPAGGTGKIGSPRWYKGTFDGLKPQAVYELESQKYILYGHPAVVVKRTKITSGQLKPGYYGAYLRGKAKSIQTDSGSFTASKMVILPSGKAVQSSTYRVLLELL